MGNEASMEAGVHGGHGTGKKASLFDAGNLNVCGSLADALDDSSRHGRRGHRRDPSESNLTRKSIQGELLDKAKQHLCSVDPAANRAEVESSIGGGFYGPEDDPDGASGNGSVNPTSALFARALVSEVTDNPRTMNPAAMTEREKKLLKAQERAARGGDGSRPVGAPGGVGGVSVLGAMQSMSLRDTQQEHGGSDGAQGSASRSVLPPNALRENRAQVKRGSGGSSSADFEFRGGKHTITIGLSLSRRHSTHGHPDTVTRQTAFDFNELQDREYKYVSSTDSSGWRAGGGERGGAKIPGQPNQGDESGNNNLSPSNSIGISASEDGEGSILEQHNSAFHDGTSSGPPGNGPAPLNNGLPGANSFNSSGAHKVAAPDTVHIPIIHIDAESPAAVDQIISALARGEIFIPHMTILPEALSVNGISPPDLVVRFGCERNDDIPPDEWPNWCLEFMHNQLYEYFASSGARWTKRPFQITLAKKVRWKTVKHMNKFFAHSERVINAWREKGPQYLDPQLSYIEGGATPEEVARPHGIYLMRNGRPTNYFPPNFEPPYTTKMTRSLLMNVIGKSWDKKRRDWNSEPVPRLVTPSMLLTSMLSCSDPRQSGFVAREATNGVNLMSSGIGQSAINSSIVPQQRKDRATPERKVSRSSSHSNDNIERSHSGHGSSSPRPVQSPRRHQHQQLSDDIVMRTHSHASAGEDFSAASATSERSGHPRGQKGGGGVGVTMNQMSPQKPMSPENAKHSKKNKENMQSHEDMNSSQAQHEYSAGEEQYKHYPPSTPTESETDPSDPGGMSPTGPSPSRKLNMDQHVQRAHSSGSNENHSRSPTPQRKKRDRNKAKLGQSKSKHNSVETNIMNADHSTDVEKKRDKDKPRSGQSNSKNHFFGSDFTDADHTTDGVHHPSAPHGARNGGHALSDFSDTINSPIDRSSEANHSQSGTSEVDLDKFDEINVRFKPDENGGSSNNSRTNSEDVDISAVQSVGESHTTVPIMNSSPAKFIERERARRKEREKERKQERRKMEALERALEDQMKRMKPKDEKEKETDKKNKTKKDKKEKKKDKKKKDRDREKQNLLNESVVEENEKLQKEFLLYAAPESAPTAKKRNSRRGKNETVGISETYQMQSSAAAESPAYGEVPSAPSMEYSVDTASISGNYFTGDGSVITVGTTATENRSLISCVTRTTVGDESYLAGAGKDQQKQQQAKNSKSPQQQDDDDISLSILQSESSTEAVPTDEELFAVGWAKAMDTNTGSYYYFTLDRTRTVWENPLKGDELKGQNSGKGTFSPQSIST